MSTKNTLRIRLCGGGWTRVRTQHNHHILAESFGTPIYIQCIQLQRQIQRQIQRQSNVAVFYYSTL